MRVIIEGAALKSGRPGAETELLSCSSSCCSLGSCCWPDEALPGVSEAIGEALPGVREAKGEGARDSWIV